MKEPYETLRIWSKSLKNLRLIYALTGEPMVRILDRIIAEELKRVQTQNDDNNKDIQI